MFYKTLIIDNNVDFSQLVRKNIETSLNTKIELVHDLEASIEDLYLFNLYIIRLDEKTEDILKKLSDEDKFIIIITDFDNEAVREKILSFHVADYVITNSNNSAAFISKVALRLESNAKKTILTVDDSRLILTQISMLLDTQNIHYIQCRDGEEAWEYLNNTNSKKITNVHFLQGLQTGVIVYRCEKKGQGGRMS